ncbi:unnamed protein product [Camellia sinensis]
MPETQELVDEAGVKIFSADIIYHLFDQFKAYTDNFKAEKKKEASEEAVYPCVLQIMPDCVFNKRGPIVLGVDVVEGIAKDILVLRYMWTPLYLVKVSFVYAIVLKELKADAKLNVPGLLVIDTHGHESFANLRSRGSGLCDITILEVDIMHGLEPQTIESLNLLKRRNTEFIVAWNKVDRIYGWKVCRSAPLVKAMKQQSKDVQIEFNAKLTQVITQLKEQGLNTKLYYRNKEMGETYSTVPTCAISGEGIPDLLLLLVQWTQETMIEKLTYSNEVQVITQLKEHGLNTKLYDRCKEMGETYSIVPTSAISQCPDIWVCGCDSGEGIPDLLLLLVQWTQKTMIEKLMYSNEVQCTVLVVKVQGHGATIDVVLVNGTYCYLNSSITDAPSNELTPSKGGLEYAIAGTALYVVGPDDDLEDIKEAALEDMIELESAEGVCVQASILGSLEALLEFLKSPTVKILVNSTKEKCADTYQVQLHFIQGLSIELTMSASGSGRGRKRKNVAGNRTDPGWEHGIEIDAATKKVQYKYCNVTRSGECYDPVWKSPGDWWDSFGDECPELKRQRHKNRQSIMNPLCLDDVPSNDEWITEKENPTLLREGNWLHVLDRNARHGCHSEDEEADALARDLEQACRDHIGENVDEIHEVSDDDDMDDNMNAPRDFDDDFDDATIGDDDIEELGDTVGDDEDEGDNEIDNVVDCGNDDFGDEDDDLF